MELQSLHQVTGTQEGQILVGKYRVERILGAGGTGTVFAAYHLQLDTLVAIKVLRPSLLTNPEAVACFTREARAAIRMSNEHVTRVFDVGTLLTGAPYMVMEFLDGADLGTLLEKHGRFSVETAIEFVLQACEGIAEAHSLNIVHRDLKPSNLFRIKRADGRPIIKVLDFGISKAMGVGSPNQPIRPTPAIAGTPSYMSPEQVEAPQSVDGRTDIWALGVILYELLTGKKPFRGESVAEISIEIATSEPQPLRSLVPDLPGGLTAAIDVCLAKDREKRYANVAQLACALLPFGAKRGRATVERIADILQVAARPGLPSLSGSIETPARLRPPERSSSERWTAAVPSPTRSTRRMLAMAGGVALVGVLAFVYSSVQSRVRSRSERDSLTTTAASREERTVVPVRPASTALGRPERRLVPARDPTLVPPAHLVVRSSLADSAHPGAAPAQKVLAKGLVGSLAGRKKADCNPTFNLDDQGRKHFKPECMKTSPAPLTRAAEKRPRCDPNFDLDDQGRKHFKPECFLGAAQ